MKAYIEVYNNNDSLVNNSIVQKRDVSNQLKKLSKNSSNNYVKCHYFKNTDNLTDRGFASVELIHL